MEVAVIVGAIVLLLFVFAYMTKRRFGVLGLALAAGYVLSKLWETSIADLVSNSGIELEMVSPVTLATLAVILLPSVVLLFGGPTYKTKRGRLIGSLLYAVLAVVFSLDALQYTLVLMGPGKQVFDFLVQYQQIILTGALAGAVVDIMHARSSGGKKDEHHAKH
ncbi:hypothetical protein GII36_04955 [Candidatus Mycosynbacter amalyticus]|uniref:Uncharacterized protein n=1 Tax=Candidatus Mycosynbacter amalyticus TaxID=2665156 RepID=A0A857MPJ7_9BACT|nr:hypothetical protein [Candidatus Mycosynbacter amalyticus]QHN43169.1 hypothetical protein GII36_04955 [Candidatus Mycosynbacter amalyticus]